MASEIAFRGSGLSCASVLSELYMCFSRTVACLLLLLRVIYWPERLSGLSPMFCQFHLPSMLLVRSLMHAPKPHAGYFEKNNMTISG